MELIPGLPDDIARECLIRVSYKDFPQIASTCREWRAEIHRPHFSRRRRLLGSAQTLLVFTQARLHNPDPHPISASTTITTTTTTKHNLATPTYRLTAFEPISGDWFDLSPAFPNRLPMFAQTARVGTELVVVGGWDPDTWTPSSAVFILDFNSATWRRGRDMPGGARSFFACAASDSDGIVFVAGGHDDRKNAVRSAAAYVVGRDEWVPMPDMAAERDECKGFFAAGRFFAVGGYATEAQGRFGGAAEAFDVASWRWGPPEEEFLDDGAAFVAAAEDGGDGALVCRGGRVAERRGGAWRDVAEVPAEVREIAGVVTWRGKMMVVGSPGFGEPHGACVLDTWRYTWSKVGVPQEFSGHVQSGCCFEL